MKVTTPISVMHREAAGFFPFVVHGTDLAISESMAVLIDRGTLGIQSVRRAEWRSACQHIRSSEIGGSLDKKKLIASEKLAPPNQKNRNHRKKSGGTVEEEFPQYGDLPAGVVVRGDSLLLVVDYPSRNERFRADHNGYGVVARPKSLRGDQ